MLIFFFLLIFLNSCGCVCEGVWRGDAPALGKTHTGRLEKGVKALTKTPKFT